MRILIVSILFLRQPGNQPDQRQRNCSTDQEFVGTKEHWRIPRFQPGKKRRKITRVQSPEFIFWGKFISLSRLERIGFSANEKRHFQRFEIDSTFCWTGHIFKPVCSCRRHFGRFLFHFELTISFWIFLFQLTAHVLGNKAEMDITQYIEQNTSLMRVGLFFEFNDARSRVATQLQKNIDRSKIGLISLLLAFYFKSDCLLRLLDTFCPPGSLLNDPAHSYSISLSISISLVYSRLESR